MRLVRVTATGIPCKTGFANHDLDISPVTLFVGENESGKTTILGLPSLVLDGDSAGVFPVLGKSPSHRWSASLRFDTGLTIERRMGRSHEVRIDGETVPVREAKAAILEAVGSARSFELSDMMSLSPSKRQEWLEANVTGAGAWDGKRLLREVAEFVALADIERWASYEPALRAWVRQPSAKAAIAWLIDKLGEAAKQTARDKKRLEASIEQHEREIADIVLPGGTVAFWDDKIRELDEQRASLREQMGRENGVEISREALRKQLAEAHASLAGLDAASMNEERESFGRSIAGLERRVAGLDKLIEENATAVAESDADIAQREHTVKELRASMADASWAIDHAELLESIESVLACCEPTDDGASESLAFVSGWLASVREMPDTDIEGLEIQLSSAKRQRDRLVKEIGKARTDRFSYDRILATTRQSLAECEERISTLDQRRCELSETVQTLNERLAELGTGNTDSINEQLAGLTAKRAEHVKNRDTLNDRAKAAATHLERLSELQTVTEDGKKIRVAVKDVTAVQGCMLAEMLGGMVSPVSAFVSSVYGGDRSFLIDLSKGAELFATNGEKRTPFSNISRSQWAIYGCGVKLSVAQALGGWRNLSVDDLENVQVGKGGSPRRLSSLLLEVAGRHAGGMLDNFLGAAVASDSIDSVLVELESHPLFTIHRLESP